jgi:acyl carrier protein
MNTLDQLQVIFRDLFDEDDIVLTNETTAEDIEDWDSITHIQLIVAIEKHYSIKFSASEIQKFKNIGEIVSCIEAK